MPAAHRVIGTPLIGLIVRALFGRTVRDVNCGLRGFPRDAFVSLRCDGDGMEFASETIARAARAGMRFVEFPIDYLPRRGASKLRTVRDGFRHVRKLIALRLERKTDTPR